MLLNQRLLFEILPLAFNEKSPSPEVTDNSGTLSILLVPETDVFSFMGLLILLSSGTKQLMSEGVMEDSGIIPSYLSVGMLSLPSLNS